MTPVCLAARQCHRYRHCLVQLFSLPNLLQRPFLLRTTREMLLLLSQTLSMVGLGWRPQYHQNHPALLFLRPLLVVARLLLKKNCQGGLQT